MEVIVREINDAYESIERGKKEGFDASVFAAEHIHSVMSMVTNKNVVDGLTSLHTSIKSAVTQDYIKSSQFSILEGSDVSVSDLVANQDKVEELAAAINKSIDNQENCGIIVQFGVPGNQQKDTVKVSRGMSSLTAQIAASQLDLPYVVLHREDVITTFSKECEPRVNAVFEECKTLHSKLQKPVILYMENLDGMITNIHASPSEGLKRKTVESALCKNLASLQPSDALSLRPPLTRRVIVIVNTETPFALRNALQDLQLSRLFYHVPTAEQRSACIQSLLSSYDNCLSEYAVCRLLAHSVAFSVRQLQSLFAHAYLLMLVCKYHSIPADSVSPSDVSKQQCVDAVARFLAERAAGEAPVVPSIPDAVLLALLDKEKPSYSVVDVTRISDWCRALSRPEAELAELEAMIRVLRERDETIRKEDRLNTAAMEPVERRRGEAYVMKELPAARLDAAPATEEAKPRAGGLMSPKFSRVMEAESLHAASSEEYKKERERSAREEAERVKRNEQKNLEERERMRAEEEKRQHSEEERRKAEFEAQKRKEEERQRRIEERLAAQEAERNKKIEAQRRIREEAARRRQEELERQEEERWRKEQEELERREREREAQAEKRRQRMQEEIARKERQNQKEAAEQMKRFEEERRRIYEVSMGFDSDKYKASTAQLDEQKSAEQKAREADQKKREEAVKKAREQMLEKLQKEKEQKEMEKRTYQRLAELRRPAPATSEEKKQRIEEMKEVIAKSRDRLKALLELKEEVKEIVTVRRKRAEEERKKRAEEERKKREEEERKRKEEEERERRKREAEEAAARKKKEEEAERRRIEAEKRKAELEKEKAEIRKAKAEKAKKMEERLLQDELMLLDCREKVIMMKKMVKELKARKWRVCYKQGIVHYEKSCATRFLSSSFASFEYSMMTRFPSTCSWTPTEGTPTTLPFTSTSPNSVALFFTTSSGTSSPMGIALPPSTNALLPFSSHFSPSPASMGRFSENCYTSCPSRTPTSIRISTSAFASHAIATRPFSLHARIVCIVDVVDVVVVDVVDVVVDDVVDDVDVVDAVDAVVDIVVAAKVATTSGKSPQSHAVWRRRASGSSGSSSSCWQLGDSVMTSQPS